MSLLLPARAARVVLLGLAVSVIGVGAAACTGTDNGGVIQGPPASATTTTATPSTGTLAPG